MLEKPQISWIRFKRVIKSIFTVQSPKKAKGSGENNDTEERDDDEIYGGDGGKRDGGEVDGGEERDVGEVDGEGDGDEFDGGHGGEGDGGKVNGGGKRDDRRRLRKRSYSSYYSWT